MESLKGLSICQYMQRLDVSKHHKPSYLSGMDSLMLGHLYSQLIFHARGPSIRLGHVVQYEVQYKGMRFVLNEYGWKEIKKRMNKLNSFSCFSSQELPPNSLAKNDEQSSVLDVPLLRENPGGIVHLPKSRSLITVNSSPHVHKKSREQFEIIRRAVRMEFELDKEKAEILFTLLKNMYFTGCQLAVRVKMNSYLFPTHDIETSQTSANENAV